MKKPSIYGIAKRVNVSNATVSYVINGKEGKVSEATEKRIYKAMDELDYTRDHAVVLLSTGKSYVGYVNSYAQGVTFENTTSATGATYVKPDISNYGSNIERVK